MSSGMTWPRCPGGNLTSRLGLELDELGRGLCTGVRSANQRAASGPTREQTFGQRAAFGPTREQTGVAGDFPFSTGRRPYLGRI